LRDGRVFCTANPYASERARERRCRFPLRGDTVSMKLSRANETRFTRQEWVRTAESEHTTRWLIRLGSFSSKKPGIFGQPLKNEGWGFQALENPRHASATKMRSSSCASSTGMFSWSFRTNCLMLCVLTGSVITNAPLLLAYQTTQTYLYLLCPTKCLVVKYHELARLAHRDHAQEGKFMASSFLRGRMAFLAVAQALTAVNRSCNRGTQDRSAWRPCRTREPRSFSFEKSRLSLLSPARGDTQESPGGRLSGGRAVRATRDVQPGEAQHSW